MVSELTTEEIVTSLLSSNEILTPKKGNFYISSHSNLGEFLKKLHSENNFLKPEQYEDKKYSFIKNSSWKV